ncbi:MAG: MATE family efflux transporter [Butyrivibrio sp.]|jgi:putative MATE family efflux protein|nr:MATE family efflux transporter [Butyrivibrio sp.]MBQ7429534.1 MATE family efflux transporter [Butyrivibrio sp.]
MENNTVKDLTVGNPMKLILGFSVPLLFGFLFQQFYNLVDTMIVGRSLGKLALAGVGSTGAINFMVIGFCMGVCSGFAIPIAQRFGAKDYDSMRKFVTHSIMLCSAFAVVMTLLVSIFCRDILIAMDTPSESLDYAYDYIFVIFLGIPIIYMYNLLSGIIRALGDSKHPVEFLVIASFVNIGLDLLFILVFHMGVTGAALATVISQAVSSICCIVFIVKKVELLRLKKKDWEIDKSHFFILLNMGVPMGLQYSITAIGSVILQVAINGQGSDAVAAVTAAGRVGMFFCCPFDALGSTMATYGGQNVGAKKLDHLSEGLMAAIKLGIVYSILAFIVLHFIGGTIASLFLSESDDVVIGYAETFIFWNSLFYIPLAFVNIVRFLIQGMGFSMFAILAGVCEMIARVLVALILVPLMGITGISLASPLAWVFADIFLIPAFLHVRNKLQMLFDGEVEKV